MSENLDDFKSWLSSPSWSPRRLFSKQGTLLFFYYPFQKKKKKFPLFSSYSFCKMGDEKRTFPSDGKFQDGKNDCELQSLNWK